MAGKYKYSSPKDTVKPNRVRGRPDSGISEPLNHEQERIQKWLKQVRFKKVAFGGVSEADVWKKIAELNTLYEAALSAERARFDALLAERSVTTEHTYPIGFAKLGKAGDESYE